MDGLVNSDHTPNAGLIEYKKAIEPVQLLESSEDKATFINRYDFITLDHLACQYVIVSETDDKVQSGTLEVPSGITAGQTFTLELPKSPESTGEVLINISFVLKEATPYLEKGFEIATAQVSLSTPSTLQLPSPSTSELKVTPSRNHLTIACDKTTWEFNTLHGTLTSWQHASTQLISRAPEFDIFRAPTDNDIPQDGWDWNDKSLHLAKLATRSVTWSQPSASSLTVTVQQRLAPPTLSWCINATSTYTFRSNGTVSMHVSGVPSGANLPRTIPRIGLVMHMPAAFQRVAWFGRGPGESYRDSKFSQPVGKHSAASVDELWVDYEVPQESGNRTDTRWVTMADDKGVEMLAQFVDKEKRKTFDFQVAQYEMRDVAAAGHPYELRKKKREDVVVVRLDAEHHGLGSGSCGPRTLDEYSLLMKDFEFEVLLQVK
jgi:beta-galactosidase